MGSVVGSQQWWFPAEAKESRDMELGEGKQRRCRGRVRPVASGGEAMVARSEGDGWRRFTWLGVRLSARERGRSRGVGEVEGKAGAEEARAATQVVDGGDKGDSGGRGGVVVGAGSSECKGWVRGGENREGERGRAKARRRRFRRGGAQGGRGAVDSEVGCHGGWG